MDTEVFRFKKWTNYIFWYQNRCFEIKDTWLHYYWDRDDIGTVIRGSMNLRNATAQIVNSKTLHLSNHNLTYYLKSDSETDMREFLHKLQELGVCITDQ
ncbi:oxysterol-binding protein 1-like [Tympanuchus pallidicinctus]|uniref:oxysterol-binding protein 1-like n=1 Tax=Tympanuchus pallidicinctus TaxID=109042 RepID=UPI0022872AB6|nr:oxysterol-binding protein 1-like [Tympanuchus pallidicinctus]